MAFTNSSLVNYTRISPNRTSPRNQPITKITIHHMAGVCSIEQFANIVANPSREMSANYGIGNDGRIVLTCPEGDRSWCSSSPWNDHRAITIEVSNSAYGDSTGWPVSNAAYNSLINLCVDICKRNGIKKLEYTGTKDGSLTIHSMFAATACCGPYLKSKLNDICNRVNERLGDVKPDPEPTTGYTVSLSTGAAIYDAAGGKKTGTISTATKYTIIEDKKVGYITYGKLKSGAGWVVVKDETPTAKTYTVSLKADAAVYDTAGGNKKGTVGSNGVFTITEDKKVGYITYGKLKSGIGWVIVKDETPVPSFKTGDLVAIASNAVYYNGGAIPDWVKRDKWYIASISGDRAVLGQNEGENRDIESPISTKYLTKTTASPKATPIKVGDWVKVTNPVIYGTNKKFTMFVSKYKVLELKGDRAVISSDGIRVTTAVSVNNLQKA